MSVSKTMRMKTQVNTTETLDYGPSLVKERPFEHRWTQFLKLFKNDRAAERKGCQLGVRIWWADKSGGRTVLGICVDTSAGGLELCARSLCRSTSI
jgi:hypothetical protein